MDETIANSWSTSAYVHIYLSNCKSQRRFVPPMKHGNMIIREGKPECGNYFDSHSTNWSFFIEPVRNSVLIMPVKPKEEPRTSDLEQCVKRWCAHTISKWLESEIYCKWKKIPGQLLHTRMKRKLLHASQHQRKLHMRKKLLKKGKHENKPKPGKHNAQSKGTSW